MKKITISNILIFISIIFTIIAYFYPSIYILGINNYFLKDGLIHIFLLQLFIGTFLHGGLLHLLSNSIFIYIFGNIVELDLGRKKFIIFFIFIVFFNGLLLTLLGEGNTIGISGFCLALISYYTIDLKIKGNDEYKGGIIAIFLNIAIGFVPGISLYGHILGVIGGLIYYFLNNNILRKKMVGINVV